MLSGIMNERKEEAKSEPPQEVPVERVEPAAPQMENEKPSDSGVLKPGDTIKF